MIDKDRFIKSPSIQEPLCFFDIFTNAREINLQSMAKFCCFKARPRPPQNQNVLRPLVLHKYARLKNGFAELI